MMDFRREDVVIDHKPLKRNRVKCLFCGEVLESYTRHHFTQCSCPNHTFTDGGTDYQRYGGMDMSLVEVMGDDDD